MASTSPAPLLVPLRLPSREQWVLHRVLGARIERSRRSPATTRTSPDVQRTFRKLESGSLLFTVPELRGTREVLLEYLRRGSVPDGERRELTRVVDRIDEALARVGPMDPR